MGVEFVDTGGVEPSEPQGGELLSITDSTHGRRAGWPGSGFRDSLSMGRHLASDAATNNLGGVWAHLRWPQFADGGLVGHHAPVDDPMTAVRNHVDAIALDYVRGGRRLRHEISPGVPCPSCARGETYPIR